MDDLIDKFSKMNLLNLEEEEEDEGFFDETEQMCRQETFTKNINIFKNWNNFQHYHHHRFIDFTIDEGYDEAGVHNQ